MNSKTKKWLLITLILCLFLAAAIWGISVLISNRLNSPEHYIDKDGRYTGFDDLPSSILAFTDIPGDDSVYITSKDGIKENVHIWNRFISRTEQKRKCKIRLYIRSSGDTLYDLYYTGSVFKLFKLGHDEQVGQDFLYLVSVEDKVRDTSYIALAMEPELTVQDFQSILYSNDKEKSQSMYILKWGFYE
ncbi:hypothetical protein [Anaerolentibacter hominis]|uniref:hypothetical protein n=1 Tax=Anaerolentibacter hominis TaxID=3079009 RepID=UPI0031B7EC67